jgi:hypothetical protein
LSGLAAARVCVGRADEDFLAGFVGCLAACRLVARAGDFLGVVVLDFLGALAGLLAFAAFATGTPCSFHDTGGQTVKDKA